MYGNFLGPDTLIIFLIILLFFGAKRLPDLARGRDRSPRENIPLNAFDAALALAFLLAVLAILGALYLAAR